MKLPAFQYACPSTLDEAVALLASHDDAKALAGGQSLVPMMAFRIASPSLIVDLRKISELRGIAISSGGVRLGAMTRWRDILDDARLDTAHPLLKAAIAHVAHYQIRNRGTVGGSLAHADPAAEMPGIAVACDAEIVAVGALGDNLAILQAQIHDMAADELPVDFKWGSQQAATFDKIQAYLADAGQISTPVAPTEFFTNAFVDQYSQFDHQAIIHQAKNWK